MTQKQPISFRLFKSTSTNNPHPYVGSVELDGKWYAIDAWVVEPTPGVPTRHFEGTVAGGNALVRQMVKSATGEVPDDLLRALEDKPFDDVGKLKEAIP